MIKLQPGPIGFPICTDVGISTCSTYKGELDTAIKLARPFVISNTSSPDIHYGNGQRYYVAGRYREAISAYRRALTLDPDKPYVHLAIGRIRALQGDSEGAHARKGLLTG